MNVHDASTPSVFHKKIMRKNWKAQSIDKKNRMNGQKRTNNTQTPFINADTIPVFWVFCSALIGLKPGLGKLIIFVIA